MTQLELTDRKHTGETTESEKVLRGVVSRVVFRNRDNGYSVLRFKAAGERDSLTVTGTFPAVSPQTHFVLRGHFVNHEKYGRQFNAVSAVETRPETPADIERYLSSGLIKGVGAKTAAKLVKAFGEKTLEMLEKDPAQAAKKAGIGPYRAGLIKAALTDQKAHAGIKRFLVEHNISVNLAHKIYQKYGNKAVEILSRNPYRLADEMWGVGFATADSIGMNLGIDFHSPQRIKGGLRYTLLKAKESGGHCCLAEDDLKQKTARLLELSENFDLSGCLNELLLEDSLVKKDGFIFLPFLDSAEAQVAGFAAARCNRLDKALVSNKAIEDVLKGTARELKISFSFEQRQAVRYACEYPLMIITGGPGCGKTTIIKALSALFTAAGKKIRLAAPTGRAAQRMAEVCGIEASTIHRLLGYNPAKNSFIFSKESPIPCDVIIVDEASMIDIVLAKDLFSAIAPGTSLILVGDKDQLPSVGPGRILGDMLSVKEIKSIELSRLYRRSEASTITEAAHAINCGEIPSVPTPDGETKSDVYFLPEKDPEKCAKIIESLLARQLPHKFGLALKDIALLTPSNRGPLGTVALNERLQNVLNPPGRGKGEIKIGHTLFRVGDRVCQRKNNYQIHEYGVFNGDTGIVHSINGDKLTVELWDGRLIEYTPKEATDLSLAYALTVHRSQGAEYPCVVLVLSDGHYNLLERQLLYTGVTRARKLLIIMGSKKAFAIGCKRTNVRKRGSLLAERIKERRY